MTPLDDVLARLVLMQKAVLPGSDAVPAFVYTQESFPFWLNRVGRYSVEDIAIDLQTVTYTILMRLVLGNVTSGFEVETEQLVHQWLPTVLLYFGQRRRLKRTNADSGVPFLDAKGALITDGTADYNLQVSGIGQSLFGIDFNIEVPMDLYTNQVTL
jgi:hypothetical protein